jgi:hypothetical protein
MRERAAALSDPDRATEYLRYTELLSDVYDAFLQEGTSVVLRTIYIALIDEGVDVWRPVEAREDIDGTFRLPDQAPAGELWQFPPGSIVRCERQLADGEVLVAAEIVAEQIE